MSTQQGFSQSVVSKPRSFKDKSKDMKDQDIGKIYSLLLSVDERLKRVESMLTSLSAKVDKRGMPATPIAGSTVDKVFI